MSSLASDPRFLGAAVNTGAAAAVIEEARRRQRRRRAFGAFAAAALAVVAGAVLLGMRHFGEASRTPITTHGGSMPAQSSVKLYLRRDASPTAIRNTIASLAHETGVARVTFVSRETALRAMKQRYPNLLSKITSNPFTDSIDVRLTTDKARSSIVPRLKRLRFVEHISYRPANNK